MIEIEGPGGFYCGLSAPARIVADFGNRRALVSGHVSEESAERMALVCSGGGPLTVVVDGDDFFAGCPVEGEIRIDGDKTWVTVVLSGRGEEK